MFGDIVDGEMVLNKLGKIAEECLLDMPKHYEICGILCYAIMPNHVHVVVFIDNSNVNIESDIVGNRYICSLRKRNVELLPEIIGKFKAAVSRRAHVLNYGDFKWQKSFHDHIIRSDKESRKCGTSTNVFQNIFSTIR